MLSRPRKRHLKNQLPAEVAAVQAAHPDKRVQVWFQDEARVGQRGTNSRVWADKGSRPRAPRQTQYRSVYLFGALCPETGQSKAWLMPVANTEAMNAHLADLGRQVGADTHALVVVDRAGWHTTKHLTVPATMPLLPLPAPELNPVELVWHELRQRYLSNRVYPDQTTLEEAVAAAWNALADHPERLQRLCDFDWIRAARQLPS